MKSQSFETWFQASCPGVPLAGAGAVLKLAAEGATVPFIARYRKEQTGNLDEVAVQKTIEAKAIWDETCKRQAFIMQEIGHQGKLTDALKEKILSTFDSAALEDLYLPYKKKRKTKAMAAKEAGIEPLSDWIWSCGHGTEKPQPGQTLELFALTFRNETAGVGDAPAVIDAAQDILTERLAEIPELRLQVRTAYFKDGFLCTTRGEKARDHSKYENYFDFAESVATLLTPEASHRYLAMRRGWTEEELRLQIGAPPDNESFDASLLALFEQCACTVADSPGAAVLLKAARTALKAHVVPSIEAEVHKALKEVADAAAITVFAENIRQLLLASPFGAKAVLGIDPGLRTGNKLAVVDAAGTYLASTVMHLQSEEGRHHARQLLKETLERAPISAIAVGNGTAGRETMAFVRAALKDLGLNVPVVMVSESGASVYSASEAAREEFPDLDLTVRGAISIARRLQDPLAELVKVDPKSIGVGQYQHDVSQTALKSSLDAVVDSCVNQVGVNLNTASYHLLAHVSGLGPALAKAVVGHRGSHGLFRSRGQLLEVPRFSKKTFEQAAGFLRIPGSDNPLDNTGVHPERYPVLESLATSLGRSVGDFLGPGVEIVKGARQLEATLGKFTFADIVRELEKPGRDPREHFVVFDFRDDIHEVKDLTAGMVCPGIVTNVTNFGAFIDIGVHQDGLAHVSQLANRFVKDPREVVKPGDRVHARVLGVDLDKNQISLTLKTEAPTASARPEKRDRHEPPSGSRLQAPTSRPAAAFNNPFAALANLRKTPSS